MKIWHTPRWPATPPGAGQLTRYRMEKDAKPEFEVLAEKLAHEVSESILDDLVHELVSRTATAINNGGLHEQLDYLVQELGKQELTRVLKEMYEDMILTEKHGNPNEDHRP